VIVDSKRSFLSLNELLLKDYMLRKIIWKKLLAILCAFFIVACSKKPLMKIFLYQQQANRGVLHADLQHPGVYWLTLYDVSPEVMWISDRPYRENGKIALEEFLNKWKSTNQENYVNNPPNATVFWFPSVAERKSPKLHRLFVIVTLGAPVFDAIHHSLIYQIKPMGGEGDAELSSMKPGAQESIHQVELAIAA
jgi:hypothetical protein